MADRTITARLRLLYNEFTKGTDAASKGLKGVSDQAKKTSQTAGRDWDALGKRTADLGSSMTSRLTLPLVGVGALATKMAGDFDSAFMQMQTLAGVSADEVDGLKESVLELAGETGKAPQELAEALFFLQSSGLDAAAAMDALELSAKASAAGLGDTQTLADAASSVMLAYADAGMTAAEALDTLLATAKAGKAEPTAIAGQLSKIIPVAAALKVSFQDVGGALAALSTKGYSAEQGATGIASLLSKLQKQGPQAAEMLDRVGLSTERLRQVLAEEGLQGTLDILKERLGDIGFETFLEDQEAIKAATALMTGDLEKTNEIFEQVANSAGSTEEAFGKWAQSMGAENAKAFAQFQIALIRLGDVLAPIAADVLGFAAKVVQVFGELPGPVQNAVVAFGALLAAAGPLHTAAGKLMKGWDLVLKLWDNWSSAGGKAFADAMNEGGSAAQGLATKGASAAGGLLALEAAAVVALVAIHEMGKAAHEAKIEDLANDFLATGDAAALFGEALDGNDFAMGNAADVLDRLIGTNLEAAERFVDAAEAAGMEEDAVKAAREAIEKKRNAEAQSAADAKSNQDAIDSTTLAIADQEAAVNEAAEAYKNYADTIKGTFDPVFGMLNSLRGADEAQRRVRESLEKLNEVRGDSEATATDLANAEADYHDALIDVGTSAVDVRTAAANLNAALAENPELLDDAMSSLQEWRDQGIIPTDEQLQFLQRQLQQTALEGVALGGVDPRVDVSERGATPVRTQLTRVKDAAHNIPGGRNVHLSTSGYAAAATTIGNMISLISQVPTTRTVNLQARAGAGWGNVFGLTGGRAGGGPVRQSHLYEVAERDVAELLEMNGHTYLIPGSDGTVVPASHMSSGSSLTGGGGVLVNVDMRGAVVANERQFRAMVQRTFNEARRKGRGLNAA